MHVTSNTGGSAYDRLLLLLECVRCCCGGAARYYRHIGFIGFDFRLVLESGMNESVTN